MIFKNVFLQEKGMGESIVNSLRIEKLPRMRSCDPDRKFPRSIFIQFADRQSKDTGIKNIKVLKENKSSVCVAQHIPEEMHKRRKQLCNMQNKNGERNTDTKIKGDKLVFHPE